MIERRHFKFDIIPIDFVFLKLQKGSLSKFAHDRVACEAAYHDHVFRTYENIAPHLPAACASVLDVGSGLGGINAVLNRHYGGNLDVCLLDGEADTPEVTLHRKPFNDMRVARGFLIRNGVRKFDYYTPELGTPRPFDLITSHGSMGLHYSPAVYLPFLRSCCHAGTMLILEVRRGKFEWDSLLADSFGQPTTIGQADKWTRRVYGAGQ